MDPAAGLADAMRRLATTDKPDLHTTRHAATSGQPGAVGLNPYTCPGCC